MRGLKTWAGAAALAAATAPPAFAQLTGGTTTGTALGGTTVGAATSGAPIGGSRTTGTGGLSSGGAPTGFGGTSSASGFGGSGGGGFGSGGSGIGTGQPQQLQTSDILAPTGTATGSVQKSNFLAGYYGNPYFQGLLSNNTTSRSSVPGGFGMALYPASAGTGAVTGGRGGATTGIGGQRGGLGTSTQSGILIPLPVQINYVAQMRFPTPPVPTTQLQTDVRRTIDTGGLTNPKAVQVITDGTNITLRGAVTDYDEARLAEGLVRLTPGVGGIANELTFPPASK